jgi:hypothetical protein
MLSDVLIMPACINCGGFVTRQYVRVFAPREKTTVRTCPQCPELRREHGTIRESSANQYQARL